jgi:WD40 repeat protein
VGNAPTATDGGLGGQGDRPPVALPGYEIEGELGRGGMGVVYKAHQTALNRPVALKTMLGDGPLDARALIRFLAEAEAVAAVEHTNVVRVYAYGEHDGRPYLALEYVSGGTLTGHLKQAGRLSPAAAAALVAGLARGVQAAHDRGIVHRDLKPGNVLLTESGEPKVTDFGLAKRERAADLTKTQAVMGTPAYMAPEQARGETKFVTPAADIYALGVILYECLTGTRPFESDDTIMLLRRVVEEEPEPPRKRVPRTPRDLELVCLKCLAKEPVERYSSAAALADDLTRVVNREPVSVRAPGAIEKAVRWVRRKPTRAAAYGLGLLALALAGFGGTVAWLWQRAEEARSGAETARDRVDGEKKLTEVALTGERIALAGKSQALAERAAAMEELTRLDNTRKIDLAHREALENNTARASELLAACRPDLRNWEWRYVNRLASPELLTLPHARIPVSLSVSRDGTRAAAAVFDAVAPVWDLRTGKVLFDLRTGGSIHAVAFSPDGTRIAAVSTAGAKVCDAHTGQELVALKNKHHFVGFGADGAQLVAVGEPGIVEVWDARTGGLLHSLKLERGQCLFAAISPDGARVATAGWGGTRIWDATTGQRLLELKGRASRTTWAAFSPDGGRLIDGCDDGTAGVWDARTGTEITRLRGHDREVTCVAFAPDGRHVATGSKDRTVVVWEVNSGRSIRTLRGHTAQLFCMEFAPGGRLVTAGWDKTVKVWDATPDAVRILGQFNFLHPAISPDGTRVAAALDGVGMPPSVHVWDAGSGKEFPALIGHAKKVRAVAFSPDGGRLVTGGEDGAAKVWDLATGQIVFDLPGHEKAVTAVAFSRDGRRIVTVGQEPAQPPVGRVWDAATGQLIHAGLKLTSLTEAVDVSADGGTIVTGSYDQSVRVWDGNTGRLLLSIPGIAKVVSRVALSSEGRRIVTGCIEPLETAADVWDAATGRKLVSLRGHAGGIYSVAFSPDGSRVATGSQDRTVRIWDTASGRELLALKTADAVPTALRFSADGMRLVAVGSDRVIRTYHAPPPDARQP